MDRQKVRELRIKLQAHLNALADAGMSIQIVGSASFTAHSVKFHVECAEKGKNGEVLDKSTESYKHHAPSLGLPVDALGKPFAFRGDEYKIVGLNLRAFRFPLIVERKDGKRFKFAVSQVKLALGIKSKINSLDDYADFI